MIYFMAIFWRVGRRYLAPGNFALVPQPDIAYRRRRRERPAEPGTAGHRWRKTGAPG